MEKNQEVFNLEEGINEVTIKHAKGLDEKEPLKIRIEGNIDSPARWLEKRIFTLPEETDQDQPDQEETKKDRAFKALTGLLEEVRNEQEANLVLPKLAHVLVDRKDMSILLVFNETNPFEQGSVRGKLEFHQDYLKWGINNGTQWNHENLAEAIKMNRSCFDSKNDANKLSAELKNLKIKVDKEVETSNDNRGNVRVLAAQKVIETTLPSVINFNIPIFKGQERQKFQAEVYVNPANFQVSLVSPDANDIVDAVRDSIIDKQINRIKEIAPEIAMIEQ